MSRIAYVSNEPISFPNPIDTDALLRGLRSFATTCRNGLSRIGKFLAMWYLLERVRVPYLGCGRALDAARSVALALCIYKYASFARLAPTRLRRVPRANAATSPQSECSDTLLACRREPGSRL